MLVDVMRDSERRQGERGKGKGLYGDTVSQAIHSAARASAGVSVDGLGTREGGGRA